MNILGIQQYWMKAPPVAWFLNLIGIWLPFPLFYEGWSATWSRRVKSCGICFEAFNIILSCAAIYSRFLLSFWCGDAISCSFVAFLVWTLFALLKLSSPSHQWSSISTSPQSTVPQPAFPVAINDQSVTYVPGPGMKQIIVFGGVVDQFTGLQSTNLWVVPIGEHHVSHKTVVSVLIGHGNFASKEPRILGVCIVFNLCLSELWLCSIA